MRSYQTFSKACSLLVPSETSCTILGLESSKHLFSTMKGSVGPGGRMPSQVNNTVITISVDGNISSGKSTLVANLKELFPKNFNFQVELVPEPLEKWTNLRGHNLLGMFYEDLTKHNFMFQHYVQLTRLMEAIKKPEPITTGVDFTGETGTVRILERSLQNNRYEIRGFLQLFE